MFGPDKCGHTSKVILIEKILNIHYVTLFALHQIHFIIRFKNPVTGEIEVCKHIHHVQCSGYCETSATLSLSLSLSLT